MMVLSFSIGCKVTDKEQVIDVLNEFGVEMTEECCYEQDDILGETPVVYIQCYVPILRIRDLTKTFDDLDITTVLTY